MNHRQSGHLLHVIQPSHFLSSLSYWFSSTGIKYLQNTCRLIIGRDGSACWRQTILWNRLDGKCTNIKHSRLKGFIYPHLIVLLVVQSHCVDACYTAFTFSLSMASSLPGLNMMRSCRLAMDPARLDKADRDGEGLIPVMALVTVERSSLWFTAWPLLLLFL